MISGFIGTDVGATYKDRGTRLVRNRSPTSREEEAAIDGAPSAKEHPDDFSAAEATFHHSQIPFRERDPNHPGKDVLLAPFALSPSYRIRVAPSSTVQSTASLSESKSRRTVICAIRKEREAGPHRAGRQRSVGAATTSRNATAVAEVSR